MHVFIRNGVQKPLNDKLYLGNLERLGSIIISQIALLFICRMTFIHRFIKSLLIIITVIILSHSLQMKGDPKGSYFDDMAISTSIG